MIEQIQRAESAIQAGDTKTAFEILRLVLKEDPNSERAWWVMSGLVPRQQRADCLQQVLRINPGNQLARETLQKMIAREAPETAQPAPPQAEPAEPSPPAASTPETSQPAPPPAEPAESSSPSYTPPESYQAWYYTSRSEAYLTILANQGLIYAVTEPGLLPRVQAAVSQGKLPDALVKEKTPIPYQRLTRIRQIMSSLRVYFQAGKKEDSIRLELADTAAAEQVLSALREKLDQDFSLNAEPLRRGSALLISIIMLLGSLGFTAFFLWGAIEVQSGRAGATGSIRTRSIITLLELLGPVGVGIIGGILILVAVSISTWLLFKPPTVTELTRRA